MVKFYSLKVSYLSWKKHVFFLVFTPLEAPSFAIPNQVRTLILTLKIASWYMVVLFPLNFGELEVKIREEFENQSNEIN